jgi:hypothetical protein
MASRDTSPPAHVKTTVDLPQELWRAAKIRAMDDHTDLRSVVIAALRAYLQAPGDARKGPGN